MFTDFNDIQIRLASTDLDNKPKPKLKEIENFQMDPFKERIIQEWGTQGYSFFSETIWSSSLQQKDLARIRKFLTNASICNADVSLVRPPDSSTPRHRWSKHYDATGQCISLLRDEFIPEGSNNLKLTFFYRNSEDKHDGYINEIHAINILRLVFGVPIARELLLTRSFSNNTSQPVSSSEVGFASYFDTQSLNLFNSPDIENSKIKQLPPETTILLDKAFSQTFSIERFILMWLAFEAIISSLPIEGSNGDKRKTYFARELGSEKINEEIHRLFKTRCDIFKRGKFSSDQIEKDCWSLYAAIQLAILEECDQRKAFILGYENTLPTTA